MTSIALRTRLILNIGVILLISIVIGSVIIYWHALYKVDDEMRAAIDVGARMVVNATDDAEDNADPLRQVQLLVEDFNGSRHLKVSFLNTDDLAIVTSTPLPPDEPAPLWFYRLLNHRPETRSMILPPAFSRYGSIYLESDSHNEIGEAWSDFLITLLILIIFCSLVSASIYWMLGHVLRRLESLSQAFGGVGDGDYQQHVPEIGPLEIVRLARGFNEMVGRLAVVERQNRRLELQLTTTREEERADLARDLHDEVGQLLFALSVDASTIQKQVENTTVRARLEAMHGAISQMQQHVKSMLGKLRPAILLDLGLPSAIDNLLAFWRVRHPAVKIELRLEEDTFGQTRDRAIYRVLQESLNNAFRHGNPSNVLIDIKGGIELIQIEITDDGSGFNPERKRSGFGISGMQDRISALGGALTVKNNKSGRGVSVSATLPMNEAGGNIDEEKVA